MELANLGRYPPPWSSTLASIARALCYDIHLSSTSSSARITVSRCAPSGEEFLRRRRYDGC
jgi:hypothetical protein